MGRRGPGMICSDGHRGKREGIGKVSKKYGERGAVLAKCFFLPYLFSFCLIMISIDLVRKLGMAPVAS
jgi:hypothetical protein